MGKAKQAGAADHVKNQDLSTVSNVVELGDVPIETMLANLKLGADLHTAAVSAGVVDVDELLEQDRELAARVERVQAQIRIDELSRLRDAAGKGDRDAQKKIRDIVLPRTGPKTAKRRGIADAPVKNEGQRLLLEVPVSVVQIAKKTNVDRQAVYQWRRGEKIPGVASRTVLEQYGIPFDAWDLSSELTTETIPTVPEPTQTPRTTLEIVNENLETVSKELRKKIVPATRARYLDQQMKLLRYREALIEKEELREKRFLSHPGFLEMMGKLFEALKPFPEAAKAAAEALRNDS